MLILNFVIFLGFNFFYASFPVHASSSLNWSTWQLGTFFSVLSGLMVLVQGPILTRLSRRFTERSLIILGAFVLASNFVLLTSKQLILLYVAAGLFALGNGLMWPSFLSLLSKRAGSEHQGAVQGFSSSLGSLASIGGLILGGILYGSLGRWIFLISATLIAVCGVLAHVSLDAPEKKSAE